MAWLRRKPPELMMIATRFRTVGSAVVVVLAAAGGVAAQMTPPAPSPPGLVPMQSQNPVCARLEAQLAAFDRSGGDPARVEQVRRYEEAVQAQQGELDRTVAQSRRTGCEG